MSEVNYHQQRIGVILSDIERLALTVETYLDARADEPSLIDALVIAIDPFEDSGNDFHAALKRFVANYATKASYSAHGLEPEQTHGN